MWVSRSIAFIWRMQVCYKPAHCLQEAFVSIPESVLWVRYDFHFVQYRSISHVNLWCTEAVSQMQWRSPSSMASGAFMSTGLLGPHCARSYSRTYNFWLDQRSLRMRKCGRMGESWEGSKLSRRCSSMQTKFYHPDITPPNSNHLSLSIPYSISFCLGFMQVNNATHFINFFLLLFASV